jgi:excisionase family DNA binding protein
MMALADEELTVRQAAEELGVNEESVRRWLRHGELRGYMLATKLGYRIRRADLDAFIEARKRWTQPPEEGRREP